MLIKNPTLALVFLFSASFLAAMTTALLQLGRTQAKGEFKKHRKLFFFQQFLKKFFGEKKWEGLFFTLSSTKHLLHLLYATFAFIFLLFTPLLSQSLTSQSAMEAFRLFLAALCVILISLLSDFLANLLSSLNPVFFFKLFAPISSFLLLLFAPITVPLFKLLKIVLPTSFKDKTFSASYLMKEVGNTIFNSLNRENEET